jgi:hypothetical protein
VNGYLKFERKMNLKVIGDSNFRDLFAAHSEEIDKNSGTKVTFELATSVLSTKTALEEVDETTDIVFIASPTNEISQRSRNNTKNREGIIDTVLTELYEVVRVYAQKNEKKNDSGYLSLDQTRPPLVGR